jgi:GT2 family glycosyltransferase
LITDSDTIFERGCIGKVHSSLEKHKVVRMKLSFKESKDVLFSRVVASARDYVNSKELAFTPGLAIRKEVAEDIGGFIFNNDVPFAVDADLNYRIRKNGVEVCYLSDAIILHDAETLIHDLKAAKRIGKGVAISSVSLSKVFETDDTTNTIRKSMKAVKRSDYFEIVKLKGVATVIYQVIWDIAYCIGSFSRFGRA